MKENPDGFSSPILSFRKFRTETCGLVPDSHISPFGEFIFLERVRKILYNNINLDKKGRHDFIMQLTRSELEIMNVMWSAGKPVSRADIISGSVNKSWKEGSIHILLNGLLKKGAIKEDGFVRCGKTFGRLFSTTISREEYYAEEVFSAGDRKSVPMLMSALISRDDIDIDLVNELEAILEEKKKEIMYRK